MDESTNTVPNRKLEPPKETRTSIVLNSVGNGMMLGAIPFLALEANALRTGKPLGKIAQGLSLAASAVGGVLGWFFGEREAERLQNYRHELANEVNTLREEVSALKAGNHWQKRVSEPTNEKAAAETVSL